MSPPDRLSPSFDLLSQEYVLIQAWKKSAGYIRYHNWYSDTLALDVAAVTLPDFLHDLAAELRVPDQWQSDPLRFVPAPKSQPWRISAKSGWGPANRQAAARKLRPLAHVSLRDQVAATALMLCLADRVETRQGDPQRSTSPASARKQVVSYGNRLFCDGPAGDLRHSWGSAKLYRAYYEDYRSFLARTEVVGDEALIRGAQRVVVVYSDLRQFFDRVRPAQLATSIEDLRKEGDDPRFFTFARRLLSWKWHAKDREAITHYQETAKLDDFEMVALPQGLVAAGFLSNVVLLRFDEKLRESIGTSLGQPLRIEDACRYVDDVRLVLTVAHDTPNGTIISTVRQWLQQLLDATAPGLQVSEEKTRAAAFRGDERALVRQSRKMAGIQRAISGGFDALGGGDILDAVQGLLNSHPRSADALKGEERWALSPLPDVRDETVARFAAGRFRTTFRSLRMLLPEGEPLTDVSDGVASEGSRPTRTKASIDDDARAFALTLIEKWVEDPSNVRLLRVGLDLWPDPIVLKSVLTLLRPWVSGKKRHRASRRVAWYCLSEVFRAAAIETGVVEDPEQLPTGLDLEAYRAVLLEEAHDLAGPSPVALPWYLRQQILLFLAAYAPSADAAETLGKGKETEAYRELIQFLRGGTVAARARFAGTAVLARRAFVGPAEAQQLVLRDVPPKALDRIAELDPSFGVELARGRPEVVSSYSHRVRLDLSLEQFTQEDDWESLAGFVLAQGGEGLLRNEIALARFASRFLVALGSHDGLDAVTPSEVLVRMPRSAAGVPSELEVRLVHRGLSAKGSPYRPPDWCPQSDRWRFHLGFLLRFVLTARADVTRSVRKSPWKENSHVYRPPESHWYQRLHGLFNAHAGFGDDWLPISNWTEDLLSALLRWPGCQAREIDDLVRRGPRLTKEAIDAHINSTLSDSPPHTSVLMLRVHAPKLVHAPKSRPLRACVVQTVVPGPDDFTVDDLTLSLPSMRTRHRNHLSAALAAVERVLDLRETHKQQGGRLDWLILPELAVHPADVRSHLVPFARAHKTIILAGLTYQEISPEKPLVNSALWVIPQLSESHGLQMLIRRQGKQHLAAVEGDFNRAGDRVRGFRPCQWLVGYQWSQAQTPRPTPLWLTASVCFDATDLRLAADLRSRADVFAIPALNRDVSTFDHMALALHYHMFQMVVVANNGLFGGSSAFAPYQQPYLKQVFHLHGQPQASVAFLEIDDIAPFQRRWEDAKAQSVGGVPKSPSLGAEPPYVWKHPPARGVGP